MLSIALLPRLAHTLQHAVIVAGVLSSLVVPVASRAASAPTHYEEEPVVAATSLVNAALLSGPDFTVDSHVEIRGYMAHFSLDTPIGPMHADSVGILAERELELPALLALDRVTRSGEFLAAVGDQAAATGKSIQRAFAHPIDTLLEVPTGVARYIGGRLKKYAGQAQSLSDHVARHLGTHGDPYPASDGPMTAARDNNVSRPHKNTFTRFDSEVRREIKRQLKYSQVKRDLAKRLGIDPYTSNAEIQDRLDRLAWVGSGGSFAATSALTMIGGFGATVLTGSGRINTYVWSADPDQIRDRVAARLACRVSDELLIRQFLRRGAFTPTLQLALVDALDRLKPTAGVPALLELGMTANSELEARFLVNALRMLVAHVDSSSGELLTAGAGMVWRSRSGQLVLPLPVDYLSWTPELAGFVDRIDATQTHHDTTLRVLVAGQVTAATRAAMQARGWELRDHVRWPGSPAYADENDRSSPSDSDARTFPLQH